MKLSYIKLPNEILEMNLTAKELAVLFYLSSIYPSRGRDTVCVKQSTIASKCGIKTTQTVSKITASLSAKGLIECRRCIYDNNSTGMIYYTLLLPKVSKKGYFTVQRQILNEQLTPVLLRAYLFICRSLSPSLGRCWNSYNDLAKLIRTSRSKAIEIIAQLIAKKVICRQKMKTRQNKRVYGDNHYLIVFYASHRPIRKRSNKKIGLPSFKSSPVGQSANLSAYLNSYAYDNTTKKADCQVGGIFFTSFFEKWRRKKKYIHNNITIHKLRNQVPWHEMSKISARKV